MTQAHTGAVLLTDILDQGELADAQANRHVRLQVHPTEPLGILNYTEMAAYEGIWNNVTSQCRGLIYRVDTREVVARPFRKFFNYGQTGAPTLDLEASAVVTDKLDGSLGILYPLPSGGWAIATRGSFASTQAIHATSVLASRYATFTPPADVTLLFEIIYPENRIVVDYGATDDLVLIGAVDIATGQSWNVGDAAIEFGWRGKVTSVFPCSTLAEALAEPPRPNAEGLVVHCRATDERVKIKQEDYVKLHRIVTGLNARTVWRHLVDGLPLADLIAPLPDEFHPWCTNVAETITMDVDEQCVRIEKEYREIIDSLPAGFTRKDFAGQAIKSPNKWAMFLLLDGRDIRGELLKRADPGATWTPSGRTFSEETA